MYENELNNQANIINNLKRESTNSNQSFLKENDVLKGKIGLMDKDFNEKKSAFEKEKMLLEAKVKFLETQKRSI